MRPRRLPPVLEAPTRKPLSERLANLCLVDCLAQLASSVDVPALSSINEVAAFPIVEVFGKRYAFSGNLEHGYCYAIERRRVTSMPALSIDQGWIWQYPPGLKPKPIGTFLRDLAFVQVEA